MTVTAIIILTVIAIIYIIGMLIMAETKIGMKLLEYFMSFFMSPEKFKSIDWNKPVPTWQSVVMWLLWIGALIILGIKNF